MVLLYRRHDFQEMNAANIKEDIRMKEAKANEKRTGEIQVDEIPLYDAVVQRNYKDTVFRMIFREKENLLSLYNALNGTDYTDVDELEITTLENAVYMNYKNDISFLFDFELLLYEHQSTYNPNMPLRDLLYVSRVLQSRIKGKNLYSQSLIRIPTPQFVVFYNGKDFQPEQQILYLSDAFEKKSDEPSLELSVIVYNVNLGYNNKLLEACRLLKEYAQYVAQVRIYADKLPLQEAVEKAVDDCIKNGILSGFLAKNRAEAIAVSIFEYDEEEHMKSERKEWREIGREEGREEGRAEGLKEGYEEGLKVSFAILKALMDDGNTEEVKRALSDNDYREQLCREYFSEHK